MTGQLGHIDDASPAERHYPSGVERVPELGQPQPRYKSAADLVAIALSGLAGLAVLAAILMVVDGTETVEVVGFGPRTVERYSFGHLVAAGLFFAASALLAATAMLVRMANRAIHNTYLAAKR